MEELIKFLAYFNINTPLELILAIFKFLVGFIGLYAFFVITYCLA